MKFFKLRGVCQYKHGVKDVDDELSFFLVTINDCDCEGLDSKYSFQKFFDRECSISVYERKDYGFVRREIESLIRERFPSFEIDLVIESEGDYPFRKHVENMFVIRIEVFLKSKIIK